MTIAEDIRNLFRTFDGRAENYIEFDHAALPAAVRATAINVHQPPIPPAVAVPSGAPPRPPLYTRVPGAPA